MAKVVVYTSQWCPYCVQAKALLQHKGVRFDEIDVSSDDDLLVLNPWRGVPVLRPAEFLARLGAA